MHNTSTTANLSNERLTLADLLATRRRAGAQRISRATGGISPVSFAQERYWLIEQVMTGLRVYNVPKGFRIEGDLETRALKRALSAIVERHELLRTSYTLVDGSIVQRVSENPGFELKEVSLEHLPESERERGFRELAYTEIHNPFNLERDLAIRGTLFRMNGKHHILLLVLHHIASDDQSGKILARDLGTLYSAYAAGLAAHLPNLPIQYRDFAEWQRNWLAGPVLNERLSYWKRMLEGAPAILDLPSDRPRLSVQSYRGGRLHHSIPEALVHGLRSIGHRESASMFMVLLSAFQVLLHRYTAQEDVVVGSPIANREHVETEALIGPFSNNLVLRSTVKDDVAFSALLRDTRQVVLDAFDHRDLPFEKLIAELNPERNLSHAPFFQTMFVYQDGAARLPDWPGLGVTAVDLEPGTAKFDLQVSTIETEDGLRVQYDYNTDLFDGQTIERMSGHFQNLLESVIANPNERCGLLRLLNPEEHRQILTEWNQTAAEYPRNTLLHSLFEQQAEQTPGAVAVMFEEQQLTYGELDANANRLASYLEACGGSGSTIGIALDRSLDMVTALLAVLKAGGTYVPLDPSYPRDRITAVISDSGMRLLITTGPILEQLAPEGVRCICVDRDAADIALSSDSPIEGCGTRPESPAYVIYTSGSTGKPKGVAVPHRAVVNFLNSMRREPGMDSRDVLMAVTTLSFDIAGLELFLPLTTGARVVLASREQASDGVRLHELLALSGATVMQATPSTWQLMLDSGWQGNRDLKILCGGEAMSRALANQLIPRCGALWNMYGPTETTIWSAASLVSTGDGPVPIGRPIDNTQFYILDPQMQPVPLGVPGELYIGGDGVAIGYLNRPALTAEKFLPNPFTMRADERIYRTGDRVRYLRSGAIEFLGRLDHQVKVRGFRIELGEIETVLGKHPGVSQCVVVAREGAPGGTRLIAYFVPNVTSLNTSELRRFLRDQLPEYMIPALFLPVSEFPQTLNGKIDRGKLEPATGIRPDLDKDYVAPQTPVEEAIASVWREVFKIEKIGVRDNFFELGGNSMLSAKLIWKLRTTFSADIPMRRIFESPTVAELAASISQSMIESEDAEEMALLLDRLDGTE